ncbi:MAG TPA: hypothetical protein DCM23_02420, partial [Firmicutes bacterium]|nr:hypothetical protein [Bacillota bacterium]
MLDINYVEKHQEEVIRLLANKGWEVDLTELVNNVATKRALQFKIEQVKAEVNRLSASVPALKKQGQNVTPIFAQVKQLNASNVEAEQALKAIELKINETLFALPN